MISSAKTPDISRPSSPCRLYLVLPARVSAGLEARLTQVLSATDIACILLSNDAAQAQEAPWDSHLRHLTQNRDLAFLIEDDPDRVEMAGADGIHLRADEALFRRARERLGREAIIGAGCGLSRHDAMVLGELGADYVAFGPGPRAGPAGQERRAELIAWWAEIFEVPCVAWNVESAEAAIELARLGADFVAPSPELWQSSDGAALMIAIGEALRDVRTAA